MQKRRNLRVLSDVMLRRLLARNSTQLQTSNCCDRLPGSVPQQHRDRYLLRFIRRAQVKTHSQRAGPVAVQRDVRPRKREQHAVFVVSSKTVRREHMQDSIKERGVNAVLPVAGYGIGRQSHLYIDRLTKAPNAGQSLQRRPVVSSSRAQSSVETRHIQLSAPLRGPFLEKRHRGLLSASSLGPCQHAHRMEDPAVRLRGRNVVLAM